MNRKRLLVSATGMLVAVAIAITDETNGVLIAINDGEAQ